MTRLDDTSSVSDRAREAEATDADYAAILAAVMETARGRWFLAEFALRNRAADTAIVMAAIERLESLVAPDLAAAPDPAAEHAEPPAPAAGTGDRAVQIVAAACEAPAPDVEEAPAVQLARHSPPANRRASHADAFAKLTAEEKLALFC